MIAMRSCQKCHRRFDAVYPSNKTICPMCEQGEMFQGEFTDDDVYIPDIRDPAEEPYRQDEKNKKKLAKLFGLNYSMAWEEEIDEDDFLYGEPVLQKAEDDKNIFLPLLADVELPNTSETLIHNSGEPAGAEAKPNGRKKKKEKTEPIHMQRRKDPYMKGGEEK